MESKIFGNTNKNLVIKELTRIFSTIFAPKKDTDYSVFEKGPGENSVQQKGTDAVASGNASFAVGQFNIAFGDYSCACGENNIAAGANSHAEGKETIAGDPENPNTAGKGKAAHAEGYKTKATVDFAHAEGNYTTANGNASHTEGYYTVANNSVEHAEGQYNKSTKTSNTYGNSGNTQHSVGIGNSDTNRKNAFEIMQNGDAYLYGVGGYDGTNASASGIKTVQQLISPITVECDLQSSEDMYISPKAGQPSSSELIQLWLAGKTIIGTYVDDNTPIKFRVVNYDSSYPYLVCITENGVAYIV